MATRDDDGRAAVTDSNERDELRTIGFRLREIQRLLGMRVQQENNRLEAEGIAPVADPTFFRDGIEAERVRVSNDRVRDHVERLGAFELGTAVELTLLTGRTIVGEIGPIDFDPSTELRAELEPRGEAPIRYDATSRLEDDGWTPIVVRRFEPGDENWETVGVVRAVADR